MANVENENSLGFVDVRRNPKGQDAGGTTATTGMPVAASTSDAALYTSVGALRTVLSSAIPAYYTASRLNLMTKNDMVYATRVLADSAGIK